jgi:hypothetical protein
MPRSALDHVPEAQVAALEHLPALLLQSIREPLAAGTISPGKAPARAAKKTRIAELNI